MTDANLDTLPEDEFDPADTEKLKKSKPWLDLIGDYDKAGYRDFNDRADNIDKLYANLERLANVARDREFQIFWANIQVLAPAVYARPPVPVVVPRFRDRRPLPRTASELLERSLIVNFEMEDIDSAMKSVRDDVAIPARGVLWLRYEAEGKGKDFREYVCIEHLCRKDFAHDPARKWKEVDWVARRAWMTKDEMRKRFRSTSGNEYKNASYAIRKDNDDNSDGRTKAEVWEIWSKSAKKVVWVSEGVEELLDEKEPPLKLEGFFPCPRPAYGTVQRESLIPVPDYVFYKDQIEEINQLTARMHALSEALKVKGFYPSGESNLGDAIEAAVKAQDNRAILVPVSNWAAFGDVAMKDVIVWLPIDQIANVVKELVGMRRQLIDDVYQITGLSDIMRGATDPNETLGAQELKSQYGSIRVRDRQEELVRIARDASRLAAEIMAENFQAQTLLDMAQMELPTGKQVAEQIGQLEQQGMAIQSQIAEAQQDPQLMAEAQKKPEVAQKIIQQAQQQLQQIQGQIQQLQETVTVEQIMNLLREQRLRPFMLEIETDSTIAADENAQKQRANEFMTSMSGMLQQMVPAVQAIPQIAPLMSEALKFAASQHRAGRMLDDAIDEFADSMTQMSGQANPENQADKAKADAEAQKTQAELQKMQSEAALKQQTAAADQQRKQEDANHAKTMRERETEEKLAMMNADNERKVIEHQQNIELGSVALEKARLEVQKLSGQIMANSQDALIKAEQAERGFERDAMQGAAE